MLKPDITGFQRWADFFKALVGVCVTAWATITFAFDGRYVTNDSMVELVKELKRDRIQADIRKLESEIALTIMQSTYAESPEWQERRKKEKEILEKQLHSLERDLEEYR